MIYFKYDIFQIEKSQEKLIKMRSKIKDGVIGKYRNRANSQADTSFDYVFSIYKNHGKASYWSKKVELYQNMIQNSIENI